MPRVLDGDGDRRAWIVVANGAHHFVRQAASSLERVPAREQFIKQDSQLKDVGRGGDRFTANLLRAGICRGEQQRLGERSRSLAARCFLFHQFRHTEIEEFDRACLRHQNVAGLQIAVDREVAMRALHGVANL